MSKEEFRYPGNEYRSFTTLLGMIASDDGDRVTIQPGQWLHSKCYGVTRQGKLQHYLEIKLHAVEKGVVFSYRDFCFGVQDPRSDSIREDYARTICSHARTVNLRIKELYPKMQVEIVYE